MIITITLMITLVFSINNRIKAKENNLKKHVAQFSNKSEDKITKIKELPIENDKKISILSDGEFYYNVTSDGLIKTITKNYSNKFKIDAKIPKDQAQEKSTKIINKMYPEFKNFSVEAEESNFENNSGYTFIFKEKTVNNVNTGNYAYIDLFVDGQLKGASINVENNNIVSENTKIDYLQAKKIVFEYLNNHKTLSKEVSALSDADYTLERNAFRGNNVWEFKTSFKHLYDGFNFIYIIDANTGEILHKSEPRLSGFTPN